MPCDKLAAAKATKQLSKRQPGQITVMSFVSIGDRIWCAGDLSGGEKARVALAAFALVPCNLLLLDEASNHLDAATINALTAALQASFFCPEPYKPGSCNLKLCGAQATADAASAKAAVITAFHCMVINLGLNNA